MATLRALENSFVCLFDMPMGWLTYNRGAHASENRITRVTFRLLSTIGHTVGTFQVEGAVALTNHLLDQVKSISEALFGYFKHTRYPSRIQGCRFIALLLT